MDLLRIGHFYIEHVLKVSQQYAAGPAGALPGNNINVLLLDDYTTSVVSIVSSQSELLSNNIFLIDKLANIEKRDKLRHLNCIVFISPSTESVNYLCDELKFPKYKKYNVFFSNFLKKSQLEKIAESDDLELIQHVQEVFWDFLVVNSNLFQFYNHQSLLTAGSNSTITTARTARLTDAASFAAALSDTEISQRILSLLLSLKMKPIIRFESNSRKALRAANEVFYELTNNNSNSYSLFNNFPKTDTRPLLLILDRHNDPLTPLLTPWTYQSMIHEYLTIDKNIVDLAKYIPESSHSENKTDELTKIILNVENDKFFEEAMYLNFADLSDKISALVNNYRSKTNNSNSLQSLEDLKNFLHEYPEFKKLSHNVNKHITISSELENQILSNNLWELSEVEQNISTSKENDYSHHGEDLANVRKLITLGTIKGGAGQTVAANIQDSFKVKLVIIYALKYENYQHNQTRALIDTLKSQGIAPEKVDLVDRVLKLSGFRRRLYNDSKRNLAGGPNSASNSTSVSSNNNNNDLGFSFNDTNSNLSIFTPLKNSNNLISNLKKLGGGAGSKGAGSYNIDDSFDYEDENNNSIYMQHRPRLLSVLRSALTKKLSGDSFPILNPYSSKGGSMNAGQAGSGINHINYNASSISNEKVQDIVVFFVDGVTYEESRLVALLNEKYKDRGIRLIIGSDKVLNSRSYLDEIASSG